MWPQRWHAREGTWNRRFEAQKLPKVVVEAPERIVSPSSQTHSPGCPFCAGGVQRRTPAAAVGADRPRRPEGAQRAQGDRESRGGKGGGQEEGGARARSRGTYDIRCRIFTSSASSCVVLCCYLVGAQLRAPEARGARDAKRCEARSIHGSELIRLPVWLLPAYII